MEGVYAITLFGLHAYEARKLRKMLLPWYKKYSLTIESLSVILSVMSYKVGKSVKGHKTKVKGS